MRTLKLNAVLSLVLAVVCAHGAASTTMIDGVSSGVSTKYNKNCLDIAYKNAHEEADGKKTDSNTFSDYKCFKDGREIYCNEVREDGQTENANTDRFVNNLQDGNACVQLSDSNKVYEGTEVSCDGVIYKNAYFTVCGVPGNISSFRCYTNHIAVDCSTLTNEAQTEKAKEDCDAANAKCNQAVTCPYGGKINITNNCECNETPVCTGTYGGEPKANGTQECNYYSAPDCSLQCSYGGTPKADGSQSCSCNTAPAKSCQEVCTAAGYTYEISDNGDGTCKCCKKKSGIFHKKSCVTRSK